LQVQKEFLRSLGHKITKSHQMWLQYYKAADTHPSGTAILRRGKRATSGG
jgi:hypothetical protein